MEQYSLLKQAVHIVTTVHESVKDIPRKIINCSILCSFFSVDVITVYWCLQLMNISGRVSYEYENYILYTEDGDSRFL
jgi:hypothetical protein